MNQILRCDWLPERARWGYLARSGLPTAPRKRNFPEGHIINPLLTKLVRSRWLDIGLVLFLRLVSVHKHAKKELGQYPAILTEQAWSIKDLSYGFRRNFSCGTRRVANHSAGFDSSCPLTEQAI